MAKSTGKMDQPLNTQTDTKLGIGMVNDIEKMGQQLNILTEEAKNGIAMVNDIGKMGQQLNGREIDRDNGGATANKSNLLCKHLFVLFCSLLGLSPSSNAILSASFSLL